MRLIWLIGLLVFLETEGQQPFRRIHFTIGSFEHVTRRYPSNNCCWEEADRETCSSCSINYKVTSNSGTYNLGEDAQRIDLFIVNKDLYFSNYDSQDCLNISISVDEWYTSKLIDLWRIKCLKLPLGENYTVVDELGSFKNMKATFSVWWECVGYAGPNCVKECNPNSRSYCDREGDLKCKDGFADPPNCRLNSPCIYSPCKNGAECVALSSSEYTCECSPLYSGKNCEIARCEPSKCAGRCENGECVCNSDKIDSSCTSFTCEGNFLCKNNGTCGSINGEAFCVCPPYTSGAYCQFYCQPECVNGRCVGDNRENSICQCFPNFVGKACEIELTDDSKPAQTIEDLSVAAKISIAFAAILGMLSIALITKIVYDRYNTKLLESMVNKKSGDGFDENEVSRISETLNV